MRVVLNDPIWSGLKIKMGNKGDEFEQSSHLVVFGWKCFEEAAKIIETEMLAPRTHLENWMNIERFIILSKRGRWPTVSVMCFDLPFCWPPFIRPPMSEISIHDRWWAESRIECESIIFHFPSECSLKLKTVRTSEKKSLVTTLSTCNFINSGCHDFHLFTFYLFV